jgi:ubiquinone biosynthesis protein
MAFSIKPEYLKRYKDVAMLFWKYGRSDLVAPELLDGDFSSNGHTDHQLEDAKKPDELAKDLEQMGPVYVKIGQLLSSRPDILPQPYIKALTRLQDKLEPFSFGEVERIVEEELKVRISKAFQFFDSTPMASASLGQAHRAILRDGRAVAVKVQRPGIEDIARMDMDVLRDISEFLDNHTKLGQQYRSSEILKEFQRTLADELDYRKEASHLEEIGKNLTEFDRIVVPQPVHDYTTSKVLTMDYVRGKKITALSPLREVELDGHALAEQLFHAYLKQILVDGLFHADPHPGNIFITDDNRIALLDLGMVGHLAPSLQEELLKLMLAISDGRGDEAAAIGLKIGERVDIEAPFVEQNFEREVGRVVTRKLGTGSASSLEHMQIGGAIMELSHVAIQNGIRLPNEFALLGKALLNLDEIGRTLDPKYDPNAAIREHASELMQERMTKSISPTAVLTAAIEAKEFVQEFPRRANRILDALSKNELKVQVDAIEEKTLIDGFQKIANRITTGVILAALIIGAAMLMRVDTAFRIFGYPGLAMLCFIGAALGGLWLIVEIARHDRTIPRQ